jgi:hypothetical protein
MKIIKVSHVWSSGEGHIASTLIFNLIKNLTNKKLIFVEPKEADILFIGPYNVDSTKNKIVSYLSRKLKINKENRKFIEYFRQSTVFRRYQPLKIFLCHENYRYNSVDADFSISFDLGVTDPNHIRIPVWKDNIDWSKYGIFRNSTFSLNDKTYYYQNILRFGSFYNLKDLMKPQGDYFLNKKNICIFSTHMSEPRGTIYKEFSKEFIVDGYGKYFDPIITSHNNSNFTKKEIMQKYSFNLCPHNNNYPGQYEEKVPEAFLSQCLPITWADENIDYDFNPSAFVNLNDHIKDNFQEIIYLLKQKEFLKKFSDQPLILSEPNLDNEIRFVKKIIDQL